MRVFYILVFLSCLSVFSCKKDEPKTEPKTPHISPVIKGKVYVANEHAGSVSVIDASSNKVVKTIYISTEDKSLNPHNIQVSPDGKTVWLTAVAASHADEEEVVILDATKDSIVKRIAMGFHLHMAHLVFSSDGNFAYVTATDANLVMEIDTKTYKITRTFTLSVPHEPHGMRYFSGHLYIANLKSSSLTIIDLQSAELEDIALGGMAVQTAVLPNGKYVFASLYDTKEIVRMDINTKEIKRFSLPESQGPIQVYPTPDSKFLYICDQGILLNRGYSKKVFVMDTETGEIKSTIISDLAPHGVVLSHGGEYAYVTNMMSDNVSVIEVSTQKIVAKIPVGTGPNGISFGFDGGGMP